MQQVDQLIHARWVIPVEPAGEVLPAHSLVVRDGRIAAVLPTAIASRDYTAPRVANLPRHALIPGFVNAHTHAAMSLFRGLADDLPLFASVLRESPPAEATAEPSAVERLLGETDPDALTPRQALELVYRLKKALVATGPDGHIEG